MVPFSKGGVCLFVCSTREKCVRPLSGPVAISLGLAMRRVGNSIASHWMLVECFVLVYFLFALTKLVAILEGGKEKAFCTGVGISKSFLVMLALTRLRCLYCCPCRCCCRCFIWLDRSHPHLISFFLVSSFWHLHVQLQELRLLYSFAIVCP
jgi:hypothetical protein